MIAILADHRVDHDRVSGQALLDDSWGQPSRDHKGSATALTIVTTKRRALGRFMTVLRHTYVI
jgi:hypothetical protein